MTCCGWFSCLLVLCAAVATSLATSVDTRDSGQLIADRPTYQNPFSPERALMNRLLARVLQLTYEAYRDLGASKQDLQELQHKRGVIQACYFQAVSCY